jgi:hypothetical protein
MSAITFSPDKIIFFAKLLLIIFYEFSYSFIASNYSFIGLGIYGTILPPITTPPY